MKNLILATILAAAPTMSYCQTTAVNFTANDCTGASHTLFTELDNGKTVVLVWIMPCGGCIAGSQVADSSVASLLAINPGSALLWIADDGVGGDCSVLNSWVATNHLGHPTMFANASNEIDQANYGGSGMPHITVIGSDRHIYYNEMGSVGHGLYEAIDNAIHTRAAVNEVKSTPAMQLLPNPATNELNIRFQQYMKCISIVAADGKTVREQSFDTAQRDLALNIASLPAGIYFVRVTSADGQMITQKFIKE